MVARGGFVNKHGQMVEAPKDAVLFVTLVEASNPDEAVKIVEGNGSSGEWDLVGISHKDGEPLILKAKPN